MLDADDAADVLMGPAGTGEAGSFRFFVFGEVTSPLLVAWPGILPAVGG